MAHKILLIEDEPFTRVEASALLRALGHEVVAVDGAEALALLDDTAFDVVVAGALAPDPPEERAPAQRQPIPSLLYLTKPFVPAHLEEAMAALDRRASIRRTLRDARAVIVASGSIPLVGQSPVMKNVMDRISAVATSEAPVLISGESGTGKDLLARRVKAESTRADKPFIAVNCAAFPETLLEAELFGHERGAFTGALQRREGRFKAADGGTLFLDEVNGLSMAAQAKLLRVLQDGSFQPIGTNVTVSVNVRLVCATNRSLKTLVTEGTFREDLYYRIKVLDIEVPPLRERHGDIPLLVHYFLAKHTPPEREPPEMSPSAWAALTHYDFPGNVRELEHAIVHALVLSRGQEIMLQHLPRDLSPFPLAPPDVVELRPLAAAVREFEREYVQRVLHSTSGNKTHAARLLGISRKNLWEKLTKGATDCERDTPEDGERYDH